MTRDDIIRLAKEAGFEVNFDIWAVSVDGVHINKELQRFAALVAAAEREACAKVCVEVGNRDSDNHAWDAAYAIRARGESK